VLVIDDSTTVAVAEDGTVTDAAALAALAASPTVPTLQALGALDTLTGDYKLATPLEVSVVPPTAIVSTGGTGGCVLADDVPRAITVVSSQLGQSFVVFDDGAAPAQFVSLNPPQSLSCT